MPIDDLCVGLRCQSLHRTQFSERVQSTRNLFLDLGHVVKVRPRIIMGKISIRVCI